MYTQIPPIPSRHRGDFLSQVYLSPFVFSNPFLLFSFHFNFLFSLLTLVSLSTLITILTLITLLAPSLCQLSLLNEFLLLSVNSHYSINCFTIAKVLQLPHTRRLEIPKPTGGNPYCTHPVPYCTLPMQQSLTESPFVENIVEKPLKRTHNPV